MEVIKGYKVFNPDWTTRHDNFQYEVGKEYKMDGEIIPCEKRFHFCEKLIDCFDYYVFTPHLKVGEVEGTGQIKREGNKICCSHIRIVKEIPMTDVLNLTNDGEGNIGVNNQGDGNRGDYNQGNYNQGDYNQGDGNRGDYNQGDGNRGDYNQGSDNIGIGNKGNYIVGLWCTRKQPFYLFNKLCSIPLDEFEQSENYDLLMRLTQAKNPVKEWELFTPRRKTNYLVNRKYHSGNFQGIV